MGFFPLSCNGALQTAVGMDAVECAVIPLLLAPHACLLFGNLFQFSFTSARPGSPRLPRDSSLWNPGVLLLCFYPGWQEGY